MMLGGRDFMLVLGVPWASSLSTSSLVFVTHERRRFMLEDVRGTA